MDWKFVFSTNKREIDKKANEILNVPINFERFLQKKHVYFRESLNYILFKIFFIASYNFFPLF